MKKILSILLLLALVISIASCDKIKNENSQNGTESQGTGESEKPTGKKTEDPSDEAPKKDPDMEVLAEWIEYSEGTREPLELSWDPHCFFKVTNACDEGIVPAAVYNVVSRAWRDENFQYRLNKQSITNEEFDTIIPSVPTVLRDNEIFSDREGRYTYVAFAFIHNSAHTLCARKINSVTLENGNLHIGLDVLFDTDNGTECNANTLIMKFESDKISEEIKSIDFSFDDVSNFEINILEDGEKFKDHIYDSCYFPYIEGVFNDKTEKGQWSEELEFDCSFEFNGRVVHVNFTDLIFAENEKCYALSEADAAVIEWASAETLFGKPVIYLYPENDTVCSVELDFDGELTCTYPDYSKGWNNILAKPDGTLIFPDGREYYCLYWEGRSSSMTPDIFHGFCIKGSESAAFLEKALADIGLTPREANEFIIYWLPILEANEYNVITFQTDAYTEVSKLNVTPTPDSMLRVYMYAYATDKYIDIEPQIFEPFDRKGFTVVEWGGTVE